MGLVSDDAAEWYDNLATTVAQRNAADPEHAASRLLGARNFFGISADGYQRMGSVLSASKGQLDALLSAQNAFAAGITTATTSSSVDATLQSFYNQQLTVLQALPTKLQTQLSPSDWNALQSFIARELIANIRVEVINNARQK